MIFSVCVSYEGYKIGRGIKRSLYVKPNRKTILMYDTRFVFLCISKKIMNS
jgi:hypothetical protein